MYNYPDYNYGKKVVRHVDNNNNGKEKENRVMTVVGEGSVQVNPDIAIVTLGVFTEDMSLEKAQAENARITNNVYRALNNAGIANDNIETIMYNIRPKYDYIDNKQVFRGYEVINKFNVTIDDVNRVGQIIDIAVDAGANIVENVSFTISEADKEYLRALELAVLDAGVKARIIGNTLKVQVNPIPESITESALTTTPYGQAGIARTYEASTPVVPGPIEVKAMVTSVYKY